MNLKKLFNPIQTDQNSVLSIIKMALEDEEHPGILSINQHLVNDPGKRLRSSLCLFFYHACKEKDSIIRSDASKTRLNSCHQVAAAIECIHLASLVHDDIIDESPMRRNQESIYAKFGSKPAIVTGVYVYANALKLIAQSQSIPVLENISNTVKSLCQGEFAQLLGRDQEKLSKDDYFEMIKGKTAVLFASSAFSGAYLATQNLETANKAYEFGLNLGTIFQITDDYLDLFGSHDSLQKYPGQDLLSGEFTLPFYIMEEKLHASEKETLKTLIDSKNPDLIPFVKSKLSSEIAEDTRRIIQNLLQKQPLDWLSDSKYKSGIETILKLISERCFETASVS